MFKKNKSPIIIIGMHRSGTSMLSDLLMELGLFTGRNRGIHAEADYFVKLNDWILKQAGASWDVPNGIEELFDPNNKNELGYFRNFLKLSMRSPLNLKFKGIFNSPKTWGFKDPVSSITLPLWLSVFPEAKVVFIKRHGLSVAESLRYRNEIKTAKAITRFENNNLYKPYLLYSQLIKKNPRNRAFIDSVKCKDISYGIKLWDFYNNQCISHLKGVDPNNVCVLTYETLLSNPFEELSRVADFSGLEASEDKIKKATRNIDPSRAKSFQDKFNPDEILKYREVLSRHGY